jgi:hypothetical protein
MCLQSAGESAPREGHVVFAGNENILFFDYQTKQTNLLNRNEIKMLFQPQYHLKDQFGQFWFGHDEKTSTVQTLNRGRACAK